RSHPRNLLYSRFVILSMNQKLPIPEPLWNTIPIDAQAALLAAWKAMGDRAVDLHRDDQQAGATVGRGIGGPLQRTGHGGPLGGGDPRRRDLLARGPAQGLAVGGGDRDVYGLTIARSRNATIARAVLGTQGGSIAVTDRWSSYDWIAADFRQICWSHLRRDFQAMIDRGG